MKHFKFYSILLIYFFSFSGFSQNHYEVKKVKNPIVIDGALDKAWEEAPFTEYFIHLDSTATSIATKAKMLWDDKNLYFVLISEDSSIWGTLEKRDSPVWEQDALEIFIDPDGDGQNYIELGIAPNGTICDILMSKSYSEGGTFDMKYDLNKLQCKSKIQGTLNNEEGGIRWICELAIPFKECPQSALVKTFLPKIGDTWRVNICRIDHSFNNSKEADLSSWNYLGGLNFKNGNPTFHNPLRFGYITFEGTRKKSGAKKNNP